MIRPEQGRQCIAAVGLAGDRQVDEQRQRLVALDVRRLAVSLQVRRSEEE